MSGRITEPITLGDKLKTPSPRTLGKSVLALLISVVIAVMVWWALKSPAAGFIALVLCRLFFGVLLSENNKSLHPLLYADQHGFMRSLRLADKTAIFDGHNIYHFGLDHKLGRKPLADLIRGLRADGYRIICFFDANIYFTLKENGDVKKRHARHTPEIIETVFGLDYLEIYVVPSGFQADAFILESLSHLPVSFVVTNDRFRDYEAEYGFLSKDRDWRKGVKIEQGKLLLGQYSFKEPLTV